MASVFLSYDRDDTARARPLAAALEKAGHSVWWDLHVRGGAQFSKVIEEALKAADAVVVLWSANSIESPWVRDEAAAGRDSGRLVPVKIDGAEAPLGFRQFQTIDLSAWRGRGNPPGLRALFADIEALAAGSSPAAAADAAPKARKLTAPSPLVLVAALAIVLVSGAAWWLISRKEVGAPTVAVTASDSSPASQQLARDLLVKLGNLQSARPGSMTLLNGVTGRSDPDLIVQAASTGNGPTPSATLALLSGEDHGVLWSKDFDQPSGTASDLKQQLAATAARVLACALDGLSQRGERLRTQTLKTYLNACAQLSEIATADPRPVIPMLQQVTQDAPGFAPAWGKLLVAQAEVADLSFTNGTPDQAARDDLARFIAQARMHAPALAETYLAETALVPPRSFAQKLALIERAARLDGDNPNVLSFRAQALQNVGRMRDGVADAERAAQIDPLSPDLSCHYMAILAYSGLLDSARDQLAHIERLWPGTTTASNCRYEFFFRYGDPKVALDMEQSKTGTPGVKYLIEARADPTPAKVQRLVDFMNARKEKLGLDAGPDRLSYYTLAMATFHRHDELFDTLMHWPKAEELAMLQSDYFRPELHEFRKEPRFLLVMKRAGLLDYWRASGKWPDFCFDADMPYDCKAEAAKLR